MYDFQDLNSLVHPLSAHHFTSSYFFRPPQDRPTLTVSSVKGPKECHDPVLFAAGGNTHTANKTVCMSSSPL